jgi:hypothetical protein
VKVVQKAAKELPALKNAPKMHPMPEENETLQQLKKSVSKDKIKVFNEDDDSDIEAHLEESRKKLIDPMDNTENESSTPNTPKKVVPPPVPNTDSSVAMSETALRDAHNYVGNLYGRTDKATASREPFNYSRGANKADEAADQNVNSKSILHFFVLIC